MSHVPKPINEVAGDAEAIRDMIDLDQPRATTARS
jgi:hypothetical protein